MGKKIIGDESDDDSNLQFKNFTSPTISLHIHIGELNHKKNMGNTNETLSRYIVK